MPTNKEREASRTEVRRRPQQERSQLRVANILDVAARLICEHGAGHLKMTDIARSADIPIGSLYQYFPEKAAIIKALYDATSLGMRERIVVAYAGIQSLEEALDITDAMIDWYFEQFRINPLHIEIWLGVETDRELLHLNNEESRQIGELFTSMVHSHLPENHQIDLEARALLLSHLIGSAVRLAVFQKDHDLSLRLLNEFKSIMRKTAFTN